MSETMTDVLHHRCPLCDTVSAINNILKLIKN